MMDDGHFTDPHRHGYNINVRYVTDTRLDHTGMGPISSATDTGSIATTTEALYLTWPPSFYDFSFTGLYLTEAEHHQHKPVYPQLRRRF